MDFMEFLQELPNPSLWLGSKVVQGLIFNLGGKEPTKSQS
jgi:hypothetical protein